MIGLKISWDLSAIRALLPKIVSDSQKTIGPLLIDAVKKEMGVGKSPVEGQGRYRVYSPSYQADIKGGGIHRVYAAKRVRPVNLYLSGKMYGSAYSKPISGGIELGFKDKKAEYHNDQGAGKSKVIRRMLPTNRGETFSRTIMQKVLKFLQSDIIKKLVGAANRK